MIQTVMPLIETQRLQLTPARADDVDALHTLWIDPGVRRYLWDDVVIARDRAVDAVNASIASFETTGFGLWIVRRREHPRLVGFAGLRAAEGDVELLIGLEPARWRGGFGTEAGRAVLRFAFEQIGLTRVIGYVDPPNEASRRLMAALGLRENGLVVRHGLELVHYVMDAPGAGAVV